MPVLLSATMTRQQVAQRLGKSVATVRRIEGVLLHPTQDSRGTHRFDDEEVEALARGIENGEVTVWQELRRSSSDAKSESAVDLATADGCARCAELGREVEELRSELEDQLRRRRRDVEELAAERAKLAAERAKHTAERREFEAQLVEFMATME